MEILSKEAVMKQRSTHSTMEEPSPTVGGTLLEERNDEIYEPLGINLEKLPLAGASGSGINLQQDVNSEFHVDTSVHTANEAVERQFFPSFSCISPVHHKQVRQRP